MFIFIGKLLKMGGVERFLIIVQNFDEGKFEISEAFSTSIIITTTLRYIAYKLKWNRMHMLQ